MCPMPPTVAHSLAGHMSHIATHILARVNAGKVVAYFFDWIAISSTGTIDCTLEIFFSLKSTSASS